MHRLIESLSMERLFIFGVGSLFGGCITCFGKQALSYEDLNIIVKLFSGIAPFAAAYGAYYMWSKNREKDLKFLDYKNDYYKQILKKRLDLYDNIHLNIIRPFELISTADVKEYHSVYVDKESCRKMHASIMSVASEQLWLTKEMFNIIYFIDTEYIMNIMNDEDAAIHEFASNKYKQINDKSIELSRQFKKDMYSLFEIEKFLHNEKIDSAVDK